MNVGGLGLLCPRPDGRTVGQPRPVSRSAGPAGTERTLRPRLLGTEPSRLPGVSGACRSAVRGLSGTPDDPVLIRLARALLSPGARGPPCHQNLSTSLRKERRAKREQLHRAQSVPRR